MISEHKKVEYFEEKARDQFQNGKEPKMNLIDFGVFKHFRAYALTCILNMHFLHFKEPTV